MEKMVLRDIPPRSSTLVRVSYLARPISAYPITHRAPRIWHASDNTRCPNYPATRQGPVSARLARSLAVRAFSTRPRCCLLSPRPSRGTTGGRRRVYRFHVVNREHPDPTLRHRQAFQQLGRAISLFVTYSFVRFKRVIIFKNPLPKLCSQLFVKSKNIRCN